MSTIAQRLKFKLKCDNYIDKKTTALIMVKDFDVVSPIKGKVFIKAAHSGKEDLEPAVDSAYEAFKSWEELWLRY